MQKPLDKLNGRESDSLLAQRLRNFGRGALAPEHTLRFSARPENGARLESPAAAETATAA